MKSPRFLAALAMAAVLTTGTTAHAAFTEVTGSGANGQTPIQQGENIDPTMAASPLDMQGDIKVEGTFTKRINNFPTPTTQGRYLRVTMPIKMDFTYDVDTHDMKSADAVVTNNSVLAKNNTSSGLDITDEKIEMTVLNFEKNDKGTNTMAAPIKFVQDVQAALAADPANAKKVLLPFELQMTSQTGTLTPYSLETIVDNSITLAPIEIPARGTVKLKLDKIPGQVLGNDQLLDKHTSLTSHNLKLKFEYKGN